MAHGKKINDWLRSKDALEFFFALADNLGTEVMCGDSRTLDIARLSAGKYVEIFPGLIIFKMGSPQVGGGTWLHPDLAIQLAQWCNKPFAMCKAHGKRIPNWFRNQETIDLLYGLADDLGIEVNHSISSDSSMAGVSAAFPAFVVTKRGAPEVGGGTWVHPDLAIRLAMWCNTPFSIQVSRWVRECSGQKTEDKIKCSKNRHFSVQAGFSRLSDSCCFNYIGNS